MKDLPLVTVGSVNYNNAKFVFESLESIKAQTYQNIELIIVDDCSTDNSSEIIREWLKTYDRPVKFITHESNKGVIAVINTILANANGKYLSMIATDDALVPGKLSEQVDVINRSENTAMVYGDTMMIGEQGEIIHESMFEVFKGKNFDPPSGNIFKDVLNEFYFYWQASLIDLALLRKINFHFDKKFISEDWDLQLALSRNYNVQAINKVCVKYRKVATSVTVTNWTSEKIHKIAMSHFAMILRYYRHPLNTNDDNRQILKKLRSICWNLNSSKNGQYSERVYYYFKILKLSWSIEDFLRFMKILLGMNWIVIRRAKAKS